MGGAEGLHCLQTFFELSGRLGVGLSGGLGVGLSCGLGCWA